MATPRHLVERFYHEVWDRADEAAAREILAPDFRFRGSLGPEKTGVAGFIDYLRAVHTSLGDFRCIIQSLLVSERRAAAQMLFRGIHRAELFGVPATGAVIQWSGAAFFETNDEQITALWVLGDVDAVKKQLGAQTSPVFS